MVDKLLSTPGPLTYFVGNANGRGLIRIETGPECPTGAGVHIASLARTKQNEAYADALVARFNVHDQLISALEKALEIINRPGDGDGIDGFFDGAEGTDARLEIEEAIKRGKERA